MKEHLIFAFISVVVVATSVTAAVADISRNSSISLPGQERSLVNGSFLVNNKDSLTSSPAAVAAAEAENHAAPEVVESPGYIVTDRGIYISGPPVNETGNTVLTVGYLTAIKGDLKEKQGLAISGAITLALDEVRVQIQFQCGRIEY